MENFSQRFVIVYDKFAREAKAEDRASSKLAFSRFVGVAQGAMQNWEKGSIPLPKYLKIIHDKLGFDYGWLLTGEGEPYDERGIPGQEKAPEQTTPDEKDSRIAELEAELKEERRLNRRLTERLLSEDASSRGAGNANVEETL